MNIPRVLDAIIQGTPNFDLQLKYARVPNLGPACLRMSARVTSRRHAADRELR